MSAREKPTLERRDFLNGIALTAAAAWSATSAPGAVLASAAPQSGKIRWRGNSAGVIEIAHAVRDGRFSSAPSGSDSDESCDVVIVGAGLSGLAAARTLERHAGGRLRILLLENHDQAGGAAKADVFRVRGHELTAAQGSIVYQEPTPGLLTVPESQTLLREWLPDLDKHLVPHMDRGFGVLRAEPRTGKPVLYRSLFDVPIPDAVKPGYFAFLGEAAALYAADAGSPAGGAIAGEKTEVQGQPHHWQATLLQADQLSFAAYVQARGWDRAVYEWMLPELRTFFGLADPVSAAAVLRQYGGGPPKVYSFSGGNAAIARVLLAAPPPNRRMRLGATVVAVESVDDSAAGPGVRVTYHRAGRLSTLRARAAIMAGGAFMTQHVVRGLPSEQAQAFRRFLYAPIVWINVVLANARAYDRADPAFLTMLHGTRASLMLAYEKQTSVGWRADRDPGRPVVLGFSLPFDGSGQDAREQVVRGRNELLQTPFSSFEAWVRRDLDAVLGAHGLDVQRDIAAISVCRWGHGYRFPDVGFLADGRSQQAAAAFGRIAFANSDLDGFSHVTGALGYGYRAGMQVLGMLDVGR